MLAIERANAPKFDGILTNKIDFNKADELGYWGATPIGLMKNPV